MRFFQSIKTKIEFDTRAFETIDGLACQLEPTTLQSRGVIELVGLRHATQSNRSITNVAVPKKHLKLTHVTNYGTMVLRNESRTQRMIVPMHIGFFQHGAQNHATSRTLVFEPNEERAVKDCFCVQAAQGGFLKKAEQRFLMLPLELRGSALRKRGVNGYNRLWDDIDHFTRKYGVARGGHLERFLRPNFQRLQPLRHAFEMDPDQIGGAYFIGGKLSGIEMGPSTEFFADLLPIYSIYCYGPSALLAERTGIESRNNSVDLTGLIDLNDLSRRLERSRNEQLQARHEQIRALLESQWKVDSCELVKNCRVTTISREHSRWPEHWMGQTVHVDDELAYLSIFRS